MALVRGSANVLSVGIIYPLYSLEHFLSHSFNNSGRRVEIQILLLLLHHPEHGPVDGAVDLLETCLTRVVHVDDGDVPGEPVAEQLPARVCGRVAGSHELNPL
jgi:hypothetical protein